MPIISNLVIASDFSNRYTASAHELRLQKLREQQELEDGLRHSYARNLVFREPKFQLTSSAFAIEKLYDVPNPEQQQHCVTLVKSAAVAIKNNNPKAMLKALGNSRIPERILYNQLTLNRRWQWAVDGSRKLHLYNRISTLLDWYRRKFFYDVLMEQDFSRKPTIASLLKKYKASW